MKNRRAEILAILRDARGTLAYAAQCRADAAPDDYLTGDEAAAVFVGLACEQIRVARAMMAEAPASTRRRWRVQDEVNARKRAARHDAKIRSAIIAQHAGLTGGR